MTPAQLRAFCADSFREGIAAYWTLARLTLPLIIVIRFLDVYFNITTHLGLLLAPFMDIVGLPGKAGIVLATAFLLQIYGAALVLAALWSEMALNVAQVTILTTMMLIAHALPVELRIVQKAGVSILYALGLRVGGAFLMGMILNAMYGDAYLQQAASFPLVTQPDDSWRGWALSQLNNWALIFIIVQVVMLFVKVMRSSHIERHVIRLFMPFLRLLGVGEKMVTMMIIGMLLGISYSGSLLINESRKSDVSRRDVFFTLSFLCLCHSIVEDTLLAMFLGGHISGVLFARLAFSLTVLVLLNRLLPADFMQAKPS